MASANDGANLLAEYFGGGSIEGGVAAMNAQAKELGLEHTHFANPHGISDEDHYTSCYDMAQILRWALEQSGCPIGPNDMLIAAQALAHECVLVTANVGEFSRITDLQVTDWLTVLDEPPPDTSPTTSTG